MRKIKLLTFTIIICIIYSCRSTPDYNLLLKDIRKEFESGNLSSVIYLSDSLTRYCKYNEQVFLQADSLSQISLRIGLDFSVTEEQVISQIEKSIGQVSLEDKDEWEKRGWLEWKYIDGNKMYFNRAASNLVLLKKFHEQNVERVEEIWKDPRMVFRLKHTEDVYTASENQSDPVVPVDMKITYTLTVHPDVVPEGEKVRCWLPWPKENYPRQKKVEMISTSRPEYIISPDTAIHSTIYMEELSKEGVPVVFQISFLYQSSGQYFNMTSAEILPYDMKSDVYLKYTTEKLPHICFTQNIKRLADSITDPTDNPALIVKKIYSWFKEYIPWTGALEYSTMPNIPEYVYQNRRGDCGMQTFLFISMLRYKGVPVRWQSGWMMPPGSENLHDWCEVYYEGIGWVPADVSYDLQQSEKAAIKEFYFSGIDSYRLIVNDGLAGPLHPEKQHLRSEPYDFQRGEVEWSGGNLYFDKWDYEMNIEYFN